MALHDKTNKGRIAVAGGCGLQRHQESEEILAAMVGRAAVCGEPCEGLQCSEGGAHGDFVDDNT